MKPQKYLSLNYLTSTATTSEAFAFYYGTLNLAAGSYIRENLLTPAIFADYYCINEQ